MFAWIQRSVMVCIRYEVADRCVNILIQKLIEYTNGE